MDSLRRIIVPESENTGFSISCSGNVPVIIEVENGSFAKKAGLKIGDKLISVNGNLVRNMGYSEIISILEYFRGKSLVLTVLPYTETQKVEEKGNKRPKSRKETEICKNTALPRHGSSLKENPGSKPSRKFTKYSRNMSDVTDNFRLYYTGIRRNSSPRRDPSLNRSPRVSPVLSTDASRKKLQLNRVGGLVTTPDEPVSKVTQKTISNQPNIPSNSNISQVGRRRSGSKHLPYLMCSPIPYRSAKMHSPEEIEYMFLESKDVDKVNKEVLEPIPPIKACIMKQANVSELDELDDSDKSESNNTITHIEPLKCRVMWKVIRNEEVENPTWKWCIASVDNGIFRVEDAENNENYSKMNDEQQDMSINPDHLYNFTYTDSVQNNWDFVLEIVDPSISVKWTSFFDDQKKSIDSDTKKNAKSTNDGLDSMNSNTITVTPKVRSAQSQIFHPTTVSEAIEPIHVKQTEAAPTKSRIHSALSRVRNFTTRRLTHTDSNAEFKKQQEEWLQKTEPHFYTVSEENKINHPVPLNICTDHVGYLDDKVQVPHFSTLPLDKWQRSVSSPLVPMVIEIIVKVIEKYGLHYVGLYRVSGNKLALDELNNEFRKPISEIDLSLDVWNDIYALSGILKSFLRNLPDGVFPKDFYFELISAWRQHENDREKRLLSVQRLLSILDSCPDKPEYRYHRETLHYLARHLHTVASNSSTNKMTAKNLAVVFAPTLLRPPIETNEILMGDYRYRIELVESMIKFHEWMFSPGFESACNVPEDLEEEPLLTAGVTMGTSAMPSSASNNQLKQQQESYENDSGQATKLNQVMISELQFESYGDDEKQSNNKATIQQLKQPPLAQHDEELEEEDEEVGENHNSINTNAVHSRQLIQELIDQISNIPDTQPIQTPTSPNPCCSHEPYTFIQLVPKVHQSVTMNSIPREHRCVVEENIGSSVNSYSESSSCSSGTNTPKQHHKSASPKSIPHRTNSIKRPSFKLKRSKKNHHGGSTNNNSGSGGLAATSKEQFMLANKKLFALSMALVSSNSHPLSSPIIIDQYSPTSASD